MFSPLSKPCIQPRSPLSSLGRKIVILLLAKFFIIAAMRFWWFSGEQRPKINPGHIEQQFFLTNQVPHD